MNLKPLGDRVIVKQAQAEEKTASGIFLADASQEKPQRGTVLAAGPGKTDRDGNRIAMEVKEGDEIVYSKYGGTELKLDGEEYIILRVDDILAVIG